MNTAMLMGAIEAAEKAGDKLLATKLRWRLMELSRGVWEQIKAEQQGKAVWF